MSTPATPARETIAACLIVRDEQERLPAALASVAFCDEVVVVDSGSRDATVALARAAGARVVEHPWAGFGAQRNVALDHATSDWILEVDADERITPQLRDELLAFLRDPPPDVAVAVLPMREWFLGRLLGPANKYPRYRTRLFRRGAYRHDERRTVHEGIWPRGPTWAASADMHHVLAASPREALADWWRYARLEAAHAPPLPGPRAYATAIVLRPLAKLAYRVLVDEGWRDGPLGIAKIALDCSADALVWLRRIAGRPPCEAPAERGDGHFGRGEPQRGPVRLVAVAGGATATRRAVAWLGEARAAGADVALVTDAPEAVEALVTDAPSTADALAADAPGTVPVAAPWLPTRALARLRLRALLRALDAEEQRRPIDALVLTPGPSARLARWLPGTVRGAVPPRSVAESPAAVVAEVVAGTRPSGPEPAPGAGGGDSGVRHEAPAAGGET